MQTSVISHEAQKIISAFKDFKIYKAGISIPYFNNKSVGRRAALRGQIGKGSPEDILHEVEQVILVNRIETDTLSSQDLKKILVDNDIGIDCSGFAYYILDAETKSRNLGNMKNNLFFEGKNNFLRRLFGNFRSVENTSVKILANDKNSRKIDLKDMQAGDIITMIGEEGGKIRDHVLIIHKVEYENSIPKNIYYVHSVAWPTHGEYGHGICEGKIQIVDFNKDIAEQVWLESDKKGDENYTYLRAKKSKTQIRRMNWF